MNNVSFKASDYLFTPGDFLHLGRDFWVSVRQLGLRDMLGLALLIGTSLTLRIYLGFGPEALFFWLFTVALLYWRWDSRLPIGLALGCLVAIPILLALYNQNILFSGADWAERVAVWAYYFLLIGVGKQILDLQLSRRGEPNIERENVLREEELTPDVQIPNIATEIPSSKKIPFPEPIPVIDIFSPKNTQAENPENDRPSSGVSKAVDTEQDSATAGSQKRGRGWRDRARWTTQEYPFLKTQPRWERGRRLPKVIDLRVGGGSVGQQNNDVSQNVVDLKKI